MRQAFVDATRTGSHEVVDEAVPDGAPQPEPSYEVTPEAPQTVDPVGLASQDDEHDEGLTRVQTSP